MLRRNDKVQGGMAFMHSLVHKSNSKGFEFKVTVSKRPEYWKILQKKKNCERTLHQKYFAMGRKCLRKLGNNLKGLWTLLSKLPTNSISLSTRLCRGKIASILLLWMFISHGRDGRQCWPTFYTGVKKGLKAIPNGHYVKRLIYRWLDKGMLELICRKMHQK